MEPAWSCTGEKWGPQPTRSLPYMPFDHCSALHGARKPHVSAHGTDGRKTRAHCA